MGVIRPKGEEVPGGWRELHEKELHGLYSTPNLIRFVKSDGQMGGAYGTHLTEQK